MTRTTRRILFYCAIIIFIGISWVVLLYAQGYKYDFSQERFIRTGAIYIKTNTSAQVLIDGKSTTNTSLLTNSVSIGGLLPATHIVSVQKSGYSLWQKKVTVSVGFVEDYTRVMLLPQTGQDKEDVKKEIHDLLYPVIASASASPTPSITSMPTPKKTTKPIPKPSPTPSPTPDTTSPYYIDHGSLFVNQENDISGVTGPVQIASNVTSVIISDDDQKLAWFSSGQLWVYWFTDTNYQPVHHAGDIALVARFNYPIKAAQWFRDNDHITLDAGGFKVIEIDTRPGLNIINY